MLIAITATMIIAIGLGAFVVLLAAVAITRRAVELDPGLKGLIEKWPMTAPSTQLRLS